MVISEDEVKKSFARVKEDILQIKRSLNKQVFSVEEINRSLGNALEKQEFYAFIKRLGSKVEEIENSFPAKSDREDVYAVASELREEIADLRKLLQKRDELADEVREVRSLKGKVLELGGSAVSRVEFSKDATKLKADLASVKASAAATGRELDSFSDSLSSSFSKLSANFTGLSAKFNSITAKAVVKEDISLFTDRMESSHQETLRGFAALKRDVDKKTAFAGSVDEQILAFREKLAWCVNAFSGLQETVSKKLVDKPTYEKAVGDLRSKIAEVQKLLESSMSEVNLDDYATKRSVKQQLASLSESLASSASSASADFSSKLSEVDEQLRSLKSQLDSVQKNVEKQLRKEGDKFASSRDIDKVREEIEQVSSSFIPSGDFYSKFDRLEGASAKAYDEFKKEIKRQRELFEERLKSLESHYRSSNDTLKAEVDQLRSSIKALSKADEQARTEMAKISTSAAKVAAKTASDLIEEAEGDAKGGKGERKGKGFSPLMVAVIIIALLVIGSASYVLMKGGGEAPVQTLENLTLPSIIIPAVPVVSNATATPAASNASALPVRNDSLNVTTNALSVVPAAPNASYAVNASAVVDKNQDCKNKLECKERAPGEYQFDCYFDNVTSQCRCFVGSAENCPGIDVNVSKQAENENVQPEERKPVSARYYWIVAFVAFVVSFFAYRALFVKEEGEDGEKVHAKPKEKEAAKPDDEKGDGDTIDLEEFFEKKESKKK